MFENEARMEGVQGRFPYDDLHLHDTCSHAAKMKSINRRISAPGAMLLKSFGKRSSSAIAQLPELAPSKSPEHGIQEHRTYLLEGNVHLTMGLQTQERYFFLFSDILLIAKQKSSTTFRLKNRIRICEIWISNSCFDEVSETTTPTDRSFVIGWPTTNMVATFESSDMKDMWYNKIREQINEGKENEHPKSVILRVLNKEYEGPVSKCITVGNIEDTDNVVKRCLDEFHIKTGDVKDYQLWVVAGKEETPYPLIGHEQPYSIKMSYVRDALGNTDDMVQAMDIDENEAASQLQFILRPTKKAPTKVSLEETGSKRKKFKKSPLINLFRKSRWSNQESSQESSPPMLTPSGKLFGRTLAELCEDDILPKPVLDLMYQLFLHGPFTTGIFRKGANQRQCRELQEQLDSGQTVALDDIPILVIGATFKIFLRSLPDCVFQCELYEEWCDAVDNIDEKTLHRIKKIMEKLPKCHVGLIRYVMCVLYHITQRCEENQMTSINLGICIGQSLLWPSIAADMIAHADAAKRVPIFIQFMIDHCQQVLGDDTVRLFGEPAQQKSRPDSSTDSDSMHSMLSLQDQQGGLSRRIGSSLDSLDNSEMETSALLKTHLFQTNLSRDSGLTSSDTQLYSEHMEPHAIPATDLQVRKKSLTRSTSQFDEVKPKQEPATVLSNSYDSSLNVARESCEIPPPVPPPRKSRRKAPDPPANIRPFYQSDNGTEVQLNVGSNERTNVSTSSNAKPNLTITKQRSSESIGSSLDDYSGSIDSGDYPDGPQVNPVRMDTLQCNDIGELRKSASGAKIYLDEQLISDSVPNVDQGQSRFSTHVTNSSSLPPKQSDQKDYKRSPPPMREPPSYEESVLRARGKAAEIRAKSANRHSWNVSPEHVRNDQTNAGNTYGASVLEGRSNSNRQAQADSYSSSVDNLYALNQASKQSSVADRYSSMQELHWDSTVKQSEGAYNQLPSPVRRGSEGTPLQMMYTPPEPKLATRDPVLKTLMVEGVENKEEVLRKVRVGMTAKGGDIFPKHMRSIIRHSLHEDELIAHHRNARGKGMRKTGSFDNESSHTRPQRSESFATRQKPQQLDRLEVPRSVEKSASDTSVVDQFENNAKRHGWKRPSKPPTYQEAIQRKSLLKSGLPLYQVSQQDVKQQREKSSKAAQLYQESMKRYERRADDPSDDRANEGQITCDKEAEMVRQPPPTRHSHEMPFRREPPPTRQIDHPKRNARVAEDQRQQSTGMEHVKREITPPSDDQRSYRQRYGYQEEDRYNEPQRHSSATQRTEQSRSSKLQREQRRNSDPRSRNVNNRNRRDHSGPNMSSSENESQIHSDEYKAKREHTTRQQTPPYQQSNNKERQNRRSKPRDQRLSDTRLENNKTNELNRQHKTGLTRSKSDSSEHLSKIGRFKELQALDSNIIEHYRKSKLNAENEALKDNEGFTGRPRRRSVNSVRNRDWHKDLAEQYSDLFYMPPPETNNNKIIYSYAHRQQVSNENQEKKRWQPPVHPSKDLIVVSNNNQSQERQNSIKKDKGRRSMPANFTNWSTAESNREQTVNRDKENKPAGVAGEDWRNDTSGDVRVKNVKERIAEYPHRVPAQSEQHSIDSAKSQHHRVPVHQVHSASQACAPKESHVVQSHTNVHQHKQVHPSQSVKPHSQRDAKVHNQVHPPPQRDTRVQAHEQTVQEQEADSEVGLTWSVAKLRNRFSQGNSSNIFYDPTNQPNKDGRHSGQKIAREATNANATEEYI